MIIPTTGQGFFLIPCHQKGYASAGLCPAFNTPWNSIVEQQLSIGQGHKYRLPVFAQAVAHQEGCLMAV